MFSFVVEGRFGLETPKSLPAALWYAAQNGETELGNKLRRQTSLVPLAPLRVIPPGLNELDLLIKDVLDYLVVHQIELPDFFWELTYFFFLHIMILPTLPVSERAHPAEDGDLLAMLVGTFLAKVNTIVASFILKSNRFVDIDGRVFTRILRYTISNRHSQTNTLTELVGPDISSRLETVWKSANAPPPDFTKLSTCFPNHGDSGPSSTVSDIPKTFALLPFHNDIFDEELAVVHVEVSDEASSSSLPSLQFCKGTPFTDAKHWHANHRAILPKHLGGEGPGRKDVDERSRQRRLRREQRFMVNMQRLSSSLTGASGRELKPILITPTRRKVSEIIDDSSTRNPRRDEKVHVNQQKKGKPVISARERIRQKNAQEKKVKEDSSSQAWWQGQLHQLQMITTYEKKMSHFRSLLRNPKAASGWLSIEVRLYHLHLTIQQWLNEHDPENAAIHDHYTVSIMRTVKELYTSDFLTKTTLCILATILISLGFGGYIPPLEDDASHKLQPDRVMEFSFVKLLKSKSHKPIHKFMVIKEDPVVWQLRVFGEYMDRSMDSAPDPRVSFEPDAWQRDVLDGLDEPKTSLLVVGECLEA
jgi:ATP-dependent RNA helicase DDX60